MNIELLNRRIGAALYQQVEAARAAPRVPPPRRRTAPPPTRK